MSRLVPPAFLAAILAPAWADEPDTPAKHDDVEVVDATPYRSPEEKVPDLAAVAKLVVESTNEFRVKEGRTKVAVNEKLTGTARDFAAYMARTGRYGHTADGKQQAERAKGHGYEYCLVAENIAYAFHSDGFTADDLAAKLVTGWRESPGHRKNMLDPDVTEIGVGVARSDKTGHYFAVQLFGRPKSRAIKFTVENRAAAAVSYEVGNQPFTLEPRHTRTHEVCRPADVSFEAPAGGDTATETFRSEDGTRLVVTGEAGAIRVTKEPVSRS